MQANTRTFNAETVRVRTHGTGHAYGGRPQLPAVNVKVHGGFEKVTAEQWADIRSQLEAGCEHNPLPSTTAATFDADWIESRFDLSKSGPRSEAFYSHWWNFACELGFEDATEDAKALFGDDVKLSLEGRSGGWLVVTGLPDLERWSPVKAGEPCPHCERTFTASDEALQACDGGDSGGCGEDFTHGLPSLKGSRVEGAKFRDGTPLSDEAGLFERWAFFEEVCDGNVDDVPYRCADLIAHNVFAREEATRAVEFARVLPNGQWDTFTVAIPRRLETFEQLSAFALEHAPECKGIEVRTLGLLHDSAD